MNYQVVDDFWNREPGWHFVPELSWAGFLTYEKHVGDNVWRQARVFTETENLIAHAKEERDAHEGRRYDLDKGHVIGSIPLSLYYGSGYVEAQKNEDRKWIKRAWNFDERFQPFRFWNKTV